MRSITTALGRAYGRKVVLSSAILSALSIFYVPYIASFLMPDIYILIDRTTYHTYLDDHYLLGQYLDTLFLACLLVSWLFLSINKRIGIYALVVGVTLLAAALITTNFFLFQLFSIMSFPLVIIVIFYYLLQRRSFEFVRSNRLVINYLAILGIILATISIYLSLSRSPMMNEAYIVDPFLELFVILSYYSPVFMFLNIFAAPICFGIRPIFEKLRINRLLSLDLGLTPRIRGASLYVVLFMALSIVLVNIPHYNPARLDHSNVSVDITYYTKWLHELYNSTSWNHFATNLFVNISGGDRPLSLLLLYGISQLFPGDISGLLQSLLPSVLAPSLVLVVYFLTIELTRNIRIAIYSSFLSSVSFQVLIGTYSGYYANWIALIIAYLGTLFLIRYLKGGSSYTLTMVFIPAFLVLMLVHTYTWTVFLVFIFFFMLVSGLLNMFKRTKITRVCIILFLIILTDVGRSYIGLGSGGIGRDLIVVEGTESGLQQLESRWSNLVRTVQVYVGGIYGQVFFLIASLIGSYLLFINRHPTSVFVLVFLSLGILPLFFGNREIIARVLYDIPFQIPAAISLFWFQKYGNTGNLIMVSVGMAIAASSIRIVTNF